jgi:hypothetical protein
VSLYPKSRLTRCSHNTWATRRRAPTTTPSRRASITRTLLRRTSHSLRAPTCNISARCTGISTISMSRIPKPTRTLVSVLRTNDGPPRFGVAIFSIRAPMTPTIPIRRQASAAMSDIPISRLNMVLRLYIDFDELIAALFPHQPVPIEQALCVCGCADQSDQISSLIDPIANICVEDNLQIFCRPNGKCVMRKLRCSTSRPSSLGACYRRYRGAVPCYLVAVKRAFNE